MTEAGLVLKAGREKSVRQRHPWIFSGAIDRIVGGPGRGDTVDVLSQGGSWLAKAGYSPESQIRARIWTWDRDHAIDESFFEAALREADSFRRPLEAYTDGYRLVNAENDGLPGLVIDRYGGYFTVQFLSAPAEKHKPAVTNILSRFEKTQGIFERSDADVRSKEGLPPATGVLWGSEPPQTVNIREGNWKFIVDLRQGHKTGFYLDQRDNRMLVRDLVSQFARGGEILNVFSYTGAFAVAAYSGGAGRVINVDSSPAMLSIASGQLALNGMPAGKDSILEGNAFEVLRQLRDEKRLFDLVILDPPKFAVNQKDIRRASRAYKDINWLAMRILRKNGILLTFSCSGLVSEDLFQKIVFSAAIDAGRDAQIIGRCGQPSDHPVRLTFPEGRYLKGLVCRVP
ncbi:MAG: class I SAM-dependent methyltransferase [Anaerolineales bacterium]|nr:class I SAM-dependent methyltransferase [Anaerolineales bacterium]